MAFQVTLPRAMQFLLVCGKISCTLPPNFESRRYKSIIHEIMWLISMSVTMSLIIPLFLAMYHFGEDLAVLTKSVSESMTATDPLLNMIFCKLERARIQVILSELMNFLNTASPFEKAKLQKHVDQCTPFYLFILILFSLTAVAFSCGPIVMDRPFPAEAWYPFSTDPLPISCSIYVLQIMVIAQAAMCIHMDFMIAFLLWYAVASFEILGEKFRRVENEVDLRNCIVQHQKLIVFVREINRVFYVMILKTPLSMTISIICSSVQLIHHEPLPVLSQFILLLVVCSIKLYITAWPADSLIHASENIASSVYESSWIGKSSTFLKSLNIVIRRSQKPLIISITGILPPLSLRFYASFITKALSFITTLKSVISE
ncbi:Odorant receptor 54 [Cephus cinctus]|uniref:Odorant receptor n=1 Tax=Cephus cinctus TaxID=211228 RepID=A0A1W6L1I2_CEPCN|nr:odorant receptor 30a [Cephus cinctus]ARN17893.1 odorant receptor 20 [Cephus cinctus]RLZ02254.1 Odorant receptor 54 [Cephus cinctus]